MSEEWDNNEQHNSATASAAAAADDDDDVGFLFAMQSWECLVLRLALSDF